MFVGVARLVLQIPGARSLKDRRKVVRSFKDRLKARYPVSVAEVGDAERWQVATIGLAVVSGDSAQCDEVLQKAVQMARTLPEALLAESSTEILPFGSAGTGLRSELQGGGRSD